MRSPYTPGTGYVLLHHAFGEVNGKRGVWGHAIGGMGAITQAMAKAAREPRRRDRDRRAGVREVAGRRRPRTRRACWTTAATIRADAVAVNVNPKLLYTPLVPDGALPADFLRRMQELALRLRHLPDERRALGIAELHRPAGPRAGRPSHRRHHHRARASTTWTAPMHDARKHGWSREPIVELLIPSTLDDTLAPNGRACREPVLPACRAASCPTAAPGTTIATRSPT